MMQTINIRKLFDAKGRIFEIPPYQRSYSWEQKHVQQFIEDLQEAHDHYYLGHFLFECESIPNTQTEIRYIIDGQQRLTTCIIFFSALRMELQKRKASGEEISNKDMLDDIADYYLKDLRKNVQKLRTAPDDNNFFLNEIIENRSCGEPATASQERVRDARKLFERAFAQASVSSLEKWLMLVENASITEHVVTDKVQAAQIFAFQNDRGKRLSKLEILKSYFMLQIYLAGGESQSIQDAIRYLEAAMATIYRQIVRIKKQGEDDVLANYWRAISGKGFDSGEVIDGVKAQIPQAIEERVRWIKNFISGLAQAFDFAEQFERSPEAAAKDLLYLNQLGLAYPFLFKANALGVSQPQMTRLAKLLENLTFRYLLRGGRAAMESRLNSYLINLTVAGKLDTQMTQLIQDVKSNGWWAYWNDDSMKNCLRGWLYGNRVDNYLLWKYELFIANENHPLPHHVSYGDLISHESIEHIAPKTPTNGEPLENGYGIYNDSETPENGIESGGLLNGIGNLMLISQAHNSSIGNKAFKTKLESYGKDNLLNQQKEVGGFVTDIFNPIWDRDAIVRRRDAILRGAAQIWDLGKI